MSELFFGFLNLNKPAGLTSHDCVARVRRILKMKKVGHGGTLDPAATGVLPIALGKATRLLQFLPEPKAYRARIRFGICTATDDLEGEVLEARPVPDLTLAQVEAVIPQFIGRIVQIPPAYSAIQRDGKRLYELARAGEVVEVPSREVEVSGIEVLDWVPGEFPELEMAISCGGGTYIRAIARDLGTVLGTGATLAVLVRTLSCGLRLEDSMSLEMLEAQQQQQAFRAIAPGSILEHLTEITLSEEEIFCWQRGQRISCQQMLDSDETLFRVRAEEGGFLGIGEREISDGVPVLHPKIVLL
ncbi:tRNA pseudouridine(55) synthase TruB [Oscillatoria sp. FACHB-1406]|uniref:tRNA pseudouridine(55) synthase TruB n=1 Tax=Oscillatoria sp. FACHB-1406 TaxID=2692846 RepID=UPI001687105E|nr:tRNA pseudouridine(55) synthase TruB [Oscillatoria sp. FACHB-1406]MBD2579541.1 tRNA pseudouridine(55) synthase TruB [Oscillatoria sp. FACHB-1406]